jgi:hypothetical protein
MVKPHGQVLRGDRRLRPRPRVVCRNGIELASKASKPALGFKVVAWHNKDAGASVAGNPGATAPDRGNGVTDCDLLLLLPCPNTRLDAHGGGSETQEQPMTP